MNESRRLPPHGSRKRYRNLGCRCVGCTRGPKAEDMPTELRWPYLWLYKCLGDQIEAWYPEDQISEWKKNGLGDYEADEVCVALGVLPHEVFPGFTESGLDCEVYP